MSSYSFWLRNVSLPITDFVQAKNYLYEFYGSNIVLGHAKLNNIMTKECKERLIELEYLTFNNKDSEIFLYR
jgi:hypothetical protein